MIDQQPISQFGLTVLPALLSTWTCCAIVKEVLNTISKDTMNNVEDDITRLITFLDKYESPLVPTASPSKKKQRS